MTVGALVDLAAPPPTAAAGAARPRAPSPPPPALPFADLVPARPPSAPAAGLERIAVEGIDVRLRVDAEPGCGGVAWLCGQVLARYLAHRHAADPSALAGRRVLEIGSGTGLVGITAALLEPSADVWVTDQDILLDLMRENGELNLPGTPNLHVGELSWGEPIAHVPTDIDVLLAADCVYSEAAFEILVKTLCDLAPVGKPVEVLFCWKKRRKANKRFFILLRKHFDSEVVMDDKPGAREVYQRQGVTLLRLRRRK